MLPIRKFERIVVPPRLVFIHLSEDCRPVVSVSHFQPAISGGIETSPSSEKQVRFLEERKPPFCNLPAAANPRVPVPKSRVVSLSPTFAGRDLTF